MGGRRASSGMARKHSGEGVGVAARAMTGLGASGTEAARTSGVRAGVVEVDILEGGAAVRLAVSEVSEVIGGVGGACPCALRTKAR